VLIEVAKLAPQHSPELKKLYERERLKGNANQATVAVARKLVAYLLAVDRSGKPFELREAVESRTEAAEAATTAQSPPTGRALFPPDRPPRGNQGVAQRCSPARVRFTPRRRRRALACSAPLRGEGGATGGSGGKAWGSALIQALSCP
jgi:hypothetical protein